MEGDVLVRRALLALAGLLVLAAVAATATAAARSGFTIQGDADFAAKGFPGAGTEVDPYVIENCLVVATSSTGILIKDTNAHFVIRDCRVANGGQSYDGIRLENVKAGTVEDVRLEGNRYGLALVNTQNVVVRRVYANSTQVGIALEGSSRNTLTDNEIPQNEKGVLLSNSVKNSFAGNRLAVANAQYGFFFADETSYDNEIPTTNSVNGVPMRWYVDLKDTTIASPSVTVKGMTNVAQIMLYRTERVVVNDPVANDGTAKGIEVFRGDEVRINNPTVKGNAGAGVVVHAVPDVTVVGGNVSLNGEAGVKVYEAASTFRLEHANVTDNRGKGVHVDKTGGGVVVNGSLVLGNVDAGVHAELPGSSFHVKNNRILDNGGHGVYVAQPGSGVAVSDNTIEDNALRGVHVASPSTSASVVRNAVRDNGQEGVFLLDARRKTTVADNRIDGHPRGLWLQASSGNTVRNNTFDVGSGDTAIHFHDEFSYDNAVSTDNLVDGVPVRWYTNVTGAPGAHVVHAGLRVEIPGVTNVAQIMYHNSSYVTLEDSVASNGTGVGVFLHQTSRSVVRDLVVKDNDGSGVLVRGSGRLLEPPDVYAMATENVLEDSVVEGNGKAANDAGVVVHGIGTHATTLRRLVVEDNVGAGVRLQETGADDLVADNTIEGNRDDGVVFDRATLVTLRNNTISGSPRGVTFGSSSANTLESNRIALKRDGHGLFFKDENSYDNRIATSNTVDGVAVQWHTYSNSGGSTDVALPAMDVQLKGITNVAQIMLFKAEHVVLDGAVARNGADRGIYVYKSSFVTVSNATAEDNAVGIGLSGTLSSRIQDNDVAGSKVGIKLETSSHNTVRRNRGEGAGELVHLVSGESNRVHDNDAAGVKVRSVNDPTFRAGAPNTGSNFVVDAGLDKRVLEGTAVTFSDAIGVSPFRTERILQQTWVLPRTKDEVQDNADVFRPTKWFNRTGEFTVTYTVKTSTANWSDSLTLRVVGPLSAPQTVRATASDKSVVLFWKEPKDTGLTDVRHYNVYRAEGPGAFVLLGNATDTAFADGTPVTGRNYTYAVSAVNGEGEGPKSRNVTVSFWSATQQLVFVPTPPRDLNATFAGRGVHLTWAAPERAGGAVTYVVERARGDESGSAVVARTTGLAHVEPVPLEGGDFLFRVSATNATGVSDAVEIAVEAPPAEVVFGDVWPDDGDLVLPNARVGLRYDVKGVDAARVALALDGADVAGSANLTGNVTHVAEGLAPGRHTAEATATTGGALLGNTSWTFEVKEPKVACPFEPFNATLDVPVRVRCTVFADGAAGTWTVPLRREGVAYGNVTVAIAADAPVAVDFEYTPTTTGSTTFRVGNGIAVVDVPAPPSEDEAPLPVAWPLLTLAVAALLARRRGA